MSVAILTLEDLNKFKHELFVELKELFTASGANEQKPWLKSYEVKKMLGISSGTLQTMRINGTIEYTKIGGLIFYSYEDIQKLMDAGRKPARNK